MLWVWMAACDPSGGGGGGVNEQAVRATLQQISREANEACVCGLPLLIIFSCGAPPVVYAALVKED